MAGEKKRLRLRRSRYVETPNQNQIPPTRLPQTTLDQPSIPIDTDRNLDLDLRQTESRSIDQPRSDPDSENSRSSRSPQRRPSYRSATPPQEADRLIQIRSTSPPGIHAGHIILIPRIALTTTKDCHLPFTLTKRQFPIKPSYAMTINKSQGQTLTKVGIYPPQSVFTHDQRYVAMSRVKSYHGLQFALAPPSENSLTITSYTNNVVFKSALIS